MTLQTFLIVVLAAGVIFIANRYFSGTMYAVPKIDLKDKFAVITGGNTGIGKETLIEFAKLGCSVIIGARDKNKSIECIKEVKKITKNEKI